MSQKAEIVKNDTFEPDNRCLKIILPLNSVFEQVGKSSFLIKTGGGGIRTHGTHKRSTVFKTAPINRSGTPPNDLSDVIPL